MGSSDKARSLRCDPLEPDKRSELTRHRITSFRLLKPGTVWGLAIIISSGTFQALSPQVHIMPAADIIITNARILTMDAAAPRAEALAIAGNRLLAIGIRDDIAGFKARHTRV